MPDHQEDHERQRHREQRIDAGQGHDAEGDERAQHQKIAMREIDDAHDAEHEIEADPDQAEIQTEQHAGDERID